MRLIPRRTREYVTPIRSTRDGYSFEMSPGVEIIVRPQVPETDDFAEQLARVLQRVAKEEW